MYERKILELFDTVDFEEFIIDRYVSLSLEDELQSNVITVLKYLPPTILVMLIFSIVSTFTTDWVRSKIQIATMGVMMSLMAAGCSFGLLMYCGVSFIGINIAAPFLVLGNLLINFCLLISKITF